MRLYSPIEMQSGCFATYGHVVVFLVTVIRRYELFKTKNTMVCTGRHTNHDVFLDGFAR